MEYRKAGDTDLTLPALGLGCWSFGGGDYWGDSHPEQEKKLARTAVDLGVTYFDTAELYYGGKSETALGHALKGIPRDRIVIGSKVLPSNTGKERTIRHCEASLRRIGTDYLDLYMVHWPINERSIRTFTDDPARLADPPDVEGTIAGLLKLRDDGKIRHIGVSNFSIGWLEAFERLGVRAAVNQVAYNALSRAAEYELIPYCKSKGTGIIGYSVLMQGILTGKYATLDEIPSHYCRTRHFHRDRSPDTRHGETGCEPLLASTLDQLRALSGELGTDLADLCLKWAISRKEVTCVLAGTRDPKKLAGNVRRIQEPLSRDIHDRINEISRPLMDAMGPSLDLFESASRDRTSWP
jgi:myo-inositol catabolism protein IolS